MIIGTIIDTSNYGAGGNSVANGGSSVIFYTENDAVEWCRAVSVRRTYDAYSVGAFTIMINTESGNVRWFDNGQEYTG